MPSGLGHWSPRSSRSITASRSVEIEARQRSRQRARPAPCTLATASLQATLPLSASVRGEIGADGVPQKSGRAASSPRAGYIGDANGADGRIEIDHAEFKFDWDAAQRHAFGAVPDRLRRQPADAARTGARRPPQAGGDWLFKISGGTAVLATPGDRERCADPQSHRGRAAASIRPRSASSSMTAISATWTSASSCPAAPIIPSGDLRLNAGFAGKRMSVDESQAPVAGLRRAARCAIGSTKISSAAPSTTSPSR